MRAATLVRSGVLSVGDFPVPRPGPGEVLVAMSYASICGSDLHVIFDGYHRPELLGKAGYPGHEGVGVIVESDDPAFPEGCPVLTVPIGSRGFCFADYQAASVGQLIRLPEASDLRRMLMAQQLGTTVFALKKFLPGAEIPRTVAVIGAGSAGLFFLQQLLALGVETLLISDLDADRVERARRLGATLALHEPAESLLEAVNDLTDGLGVDLVIEAAGYDATRATALAAVRVQGRAGMFGYPEVDGPGAPFPVAMAFHKSVSVDWVSGTQSEPGLTSFRTAVELIGSSGLSVDHCLESSYPLDRSVEAVAAAREHGRGAAKITIVIAAPTD